VSELLEYLGFSIDTRDIERANRVGGHDKENNGPRAIVMELVSERLKHAILGNGIFFCISFLLTTFGLHQNFNFQQCNFLVLKI